MRTPPEKHDLLHREVSDLGGKPGMPLTLADRSLEPWEKRCHATLSCLAWREVMSTEAKRRSVEDMGQAVYAGLTYYEKWITAAARFLMEHGYFTQDELAQQAASHTGLDAGEELPGFIAGARVRIKATPTVGHSRIPSYARGREGIIERVLPDFLIPEDEAWQRLDGRAETLYRVRLDQHALWPDYRPAADDVLELEIFEHWLEPVAGEVPVSGHAHDHAVMDDPAEAGEFEVLETAVRELAIERGLFSAEDHRRWIEWMDAATPGSWSALGGPHLDRSRLP